MSSNFISSEADFLELDEIDRIQRHYWKQQSEYVQRQSDFYQDFFGERKLTGDLGEIVDSAVYRQGNVTSGSASISTLW